MKIIRVTPIVLLCVAAMTLSPSPSQANDADYIGLPDLDSVRATSHKDLILVLPDGGDFAIPDPGMEVHYEALTAVGSDEAREVLVVADEGGYVAAQVGDKSYGSPQGLKYLESISSTLTAQEDSRDDTDSSQPFAASPKCTSFDSVMLGHTWSNRTVEWQYNPAGEKGKGSAATLQRAANRWKGNLQDPCGNTGYSSLRTSYAGTTTRTALPTQAGGCGAFAVAKNTKGWGTLPKGTLAATCTYTVGAAPHRSDQKYSTNYIWNTGSGTSCSGTRYDLQGVATHEFGHTYGLGHSQQSNQQVMKPYVGTCESAMRTLGRGDIRGINYLYG